MLPLFNRTSRAGLLARRSAAVGAIVAVTMLGNLRLQAAEIGQPLSTRAAGVGGLAPPVPEPVTAQFTGRHGGGSKLEAPPVPNGALDDDTQLVPAIYAWDKDVRFVYYRHMSKWM